MTNYEQQQRMMMGLTGFWDNYVTPTGPVTNSNPLDRQGWGSPHDTPVDWNQVAHEERMRIWAREEAEVDEDGSVGGFDFALEEEESRVENFQEMLDRIDWVERNGLFRTLHPNGNSSYMLPGCNPIKVKDRGYL